MSKQPLPAGLGATPLNPAQAAQTSNADAMLLLERQHGVRVVAPCVSVGRQLSGAEP